MAAIIRFIVAHSSHLSWITDQERLPRFSTPLNVHRKTRKADSIFRSDSDFSPDHPSLLQSIFFSPEKMFQENEEDERNRNVSSCPSDGDFEDGCLKVKIAFSSLVFLLSLSLGLVAFRSLSSQTGRKARDFFFLVHMLNRPLPLRPGLTVPAISFPGPRGRLGRSPFFFIFWVTATAEEMKNSERKEKKKKENSRLRMRRKPST